MNFVALTPATSFEQTGGGGRMDERVLLYWLLDRAWGIHGSRAALYVLQDYASTTSFERAVNMFDPKSINEQIAEDFVSSLANQIREEKEPGKVGSSQRFRGIAPHLFEDRCPARRRRDEGNVRDGLASCVDCSRVSVSGR